jgi:hypothetical protein
LTERDDRPQGDPELTSQVMRRLEKDRKKEGPPKEDKRRRPRLAYAFTLLGMIGVLGASALYLIISRGGGDEPDPNATPEGVIPSIGPIEETFDIPSKYWDLRVDPVVGKLEYEDGYFKFNVHQADSWLISRSTILTTPGSGWVLLRPLTSPAKGSAYGFMCHVQENGDGYALALTPDNLIWIMKIEDGVETILAEGVYQYVTYEPHVMSFSCSDGSIGFRLDMMNVIWVEDSTFSEGDFALFVRSGEQGELVIGFDEYSFREMHP